jgi:hypothetical protein
MNFLKPVKFQKLNRFFIYTFNCLFHNKKKYSVGTDFGLFGLFNSLMLLPAS